MFKEPYYFIGRARNKDVFLTRHAAANIMRYRVSVQSIIKTLEKPSEIFRDTAPPKHRGFKRFCYVKSFRNKYLIVVTEEDGLIIVVTSFRISDRKKYERHRENKIRRGEWIPYG